MYNEWLIRVMMAGAQAGDWRIVERSEDNCWVGRELQALEWQQMQHVDIFFISWIFHVTAGKALVLMWMMAEFNLTYFHGLLALLTRTDLLLMLLVIPLTPVTFYISVLIVFGKFTSKSLINLIYHIGWTNGSQVYYNELMCWSDATCQQKPPSGIDQANDCGNVMIM